MIQIKQMNKVGLSLDRRLEAAQACTGQVKLKETVRERF